MKKLLCAAIALLYASPANAGEFPVTITPTAEQEARWAKQEKERIKRRNWNIVKPIFIANTIVHVADAYTTYECTKLPNCRETNSLYGGDKPSLKTIVAIKGATIIGSYFFSKKISEINPAAGAVFLSASGIVTGKYVAGNIKIIW